MAVNNHAALPLRHRKKVRQRAELLRISANLFRRDGYEGTRMEDIAEQADVSVPTVYSYFASKHNVLIELLMEDRSEVQAAFDIVVRHTHAIPAAALSDIIRSHIAT